MRPRAAPRAATATAAVACALGLALAACGDNAAVPPDAGRPDASLADTVAAIAALPGVTIHEAGTDRAPGYHYYLLTFDQPVDHAHPEGPHFTQGATLLLGDAAAPTVLMNTGYWNFQLDRPFELTQLLHGNQLVMEHRYFGASRPSPADWSYLTIAQAAADQHAIVQLLRPILTGRWLTTGQSKGGMTSIYHRRFYPDDVDGTVAYVAPISFGAPDYRYDTWVEQTIGSATCRDAVKAVATELLAHRRAMLETRAAAEAASQGYAYTRIQLAPAVEAAVGGLYWSFWQFYGGPYCGVVPDAATATDDELWAMLEGTPGGTGVWGYGVSPVYGNDDAELAAFEAYDYQAAVELGYPGTHDTYLDGLTKYGTADYDGANPVGVTLPPYDGGAAMNDVAGWVAGGGGHLLFVYGGWDPWTGGKFALGNATDAAELIVADHDHGALVTELAPADRTAALAMIAAWSGVTPDVAAVKAAAAAAARPAPPPRERPPSALRRLVQVRARGPLR